MSRQSPVRFLPTLIILILIVPFYFTHPSGVIPVDAELNPQISLPIIYKLFQTGPGTVVGNVFDAKLGPTDGPIIDAKVCLQGTTLCTFSDGDGSYRLENVPAGFRKISAIDQGLSFDSLAQNVLVKAYQEVILNFALSESLDFDDYRIVLTWGATPKDLDAHLWTPDPALPHVFHEFGFRGSCPPNPTTTACLDYDEVNGFGPETITIFEPEVSPGADIFSYGVLNQAYPRPGVPPIIESDARVQLYDASGLVATFDVPREGSLDFDMWYVFDLNGDTGEIIIQQCLTTYPGDVPPECPP